MKSNKDKHRGGFLRRMFRLLLLLIVIAGALCLIPLLSHGSAPEQEFEHQVSILTYNTHRMGMFKKPDYNRVIHYIRRTDADIVCLQEVEVYKSNQYLTLSDLRDAMRQYPYTYYDFSVYNKRRQFGNVVFSKYPLINKQTVRYDSRANISSRCDVVIGGDTLRLIDNHLESNRFTREDFHLPDSLTSEQLKESAHRISEKLSSAGHIRHAQARILHDEIEQSPYPVLVVGDFNDTPVSYTYWRISRGLTDAFLATSWGHMGNTFVKHHLGIRIDYILCSPTLTPLSCDVDRVDYSDHYPIRAVIAW